MIVRDKILKAYTTDLKETENFLQVSPVLTQCRLKSIEKKFQQSNVITDNLRSFRKHMFSYIFNDIIGRELHDGKKFESSLYDHLRLENLHELIKRSGPGSRMSFVYALYKNTIKKIVDNYVEFTENPIGGDNRITFDDEELEIAGELDPLGQGPESSHSSSRTTGGSAKPTRAPPKGPVPPEGIRI